MPEPYRKFTNDIYPLISDGRKTEPFFKSCCCFSLRTGCLIIGWFNIVATIVGSIAFIVYLAMSKSDLEEKVQEEGQSHGDSKIEGTLTILYVVILISGIITVGLNAIMLTGTYKRYPKSLGAYVRVTIIMSIFNLIHSVWRNMATPLYDIPAFISLLYCGFTAFIVYCHKEELELDATQTSN